MLEITNGISAKELTKNLLLKYSLFIKDLSGKVKLDDRQYVRVAVRDEKDNAKLVEALRKEMESK